MRLESKSRFRTNKMAGNNRKRPPYGMLLLLALGAAVLSVVLLHKMREKRVLSLLLQDRDQQLLALELLLQRERENTREIKRKLEALKAKATSLRSEKTELNSKLIETEGTITYLKRTQKELEAALGEKQNQINELEEKAAESTASKLQITTLTELVKEKEAKIEEMKHHLLNLQPSENTSAENNIASRNGDVIEHRKENVTSENVQLEEHSSSGGESSIIEAKQVNSGNETGSNQHDDIPKEGTWVTFQTNLEDEGLKNETGSGADLNAGASGDNQLEKVEVSQESEDSGQGKERDQGSSVEVKEQWLESTNGKQIGKIGENSNDTEGQEHVTKHVDAEKLQDPQNGNEQKLTSADLKLAEKNDIKMRVGHGGRTKTKSRRRWRVSKEEELEKHGSMHFEISQNNENQLRQKEHEDPSKAEIYRKDTDFNDSHLNMIESSQVTGNSIVGDGRDDGDASKSGEQILLPQHDSMETVTNFNDNKVSETSLESKEFLQVDGVGVRNDTGDKNELNDIKRDSVSKYGNAEIPNDSQEKTQNPEGGEGLQDHGEDSFNETAQNGGEKIPSTYGNQEGSDNPHKNGLENKSDNNEDGITTDSINNSQIDAERKDGIIEQTMTAEVKTETVEEKTETVDSSNSGDDNEEENDKMIKKNAENSKSKDIAEF